MKRFMKTTLLLPMVLSGSLLVAQSAPQQQPPAEGQTQENPQQSITGKITKADDGKYVLLDSAGTTSNSMTKLSSVLPSGTTTTTTSHPEELRHNTIYGVAVGGGVDIRVAFLHLSPEIRYTRWAEQHFRDTNDLLHWNENQAEFLLGITFGGTAH